MANKEVGFVVNDEYKAWIKDIKDRIKHSQIKAAVKVNYELLDLYWDIGKDIVAKQRNAKWGDAFLTTMSRDLQKTFPNMSGFSVQNLKSIRYWYRFYNSDENGLQAVSQMEPIEKMVKNIPWGHNQRIMYKCKSIQEALFYIQKTMDNGWSRTVLEHQIDSGLYSRQGKAVTNFQLNWLTDCKPICSRNNNIYQKSLFLRHSFTVFIDFLENIFLHTFFWNR